MEYNPLGRTGLKVSQLSFGASSLGGVFHDIDESRAIEAVYTAIDGGMNLIDVSPYYGHYRAETVLGKALRQIPRDKYILSTKVGRYGQNGVNTWDYSGKRAQESVTESMERRRSPRHHERQRIHLPQRIQRRIDSRIQIEIIRRRRIAHIHEKRIRSLPLHEPFHRHGFLTSRKQYYKEHSIG